MRGSGKLEILGMVKRTMPFFKARAFAYLVLGLVQLVFLLVVAGIGYVLFLLFRGAALPILILGLGTIGGFITIRRVAEQYFLYMLKIGHVAVITEFYHKGTLPAGVSQLDFGKERVTRHFGSSNALFAMDQIVASSVRQILSWLSRQLSFLEGIPQLKTLLDLGRKILSLAANYVDEAVMSYICQKEGGDVWQAAGDGLVLYAQSWKKLLQTAAIFSVATLVVSGILFLIVLAPCLGIARLFFSTVQTQMLAGFLGLVIAAMITNMLKSLLFDPLATIAMVLTYNDAIQGEEPSVDLKGQLISVCPKFGELINRSGSPLPTDTRFHFPKFFGR